MPQLLVLDRITCEAVAALGLDATVDKVEDYPTITGDSVMTTSALVIDEHAPLGGRVPTPTPLRQLLTAAAAHYDHIQNRIEGNQP